MNWRAAELAHYADAIRWLDAVKAGKSYELVLRFSQSKFGLNQASVHGIERLKTAASFFSLIMKAGLRSVNDRFRVF